MLVLIAQLNLLTSDPADLQAAFDLMEGDGFWERSMGEPAEDFIGATNIRTANNWLRGEGYWLDRHDDEGPRGFACVYGAGGGHRYYIRPDGRVDYSLHHGMSLRKDAESLGFHCT